MADENAPAEIRAAPKPREGGTAESDVAAQVNNVSRAVKILEDKTSNLRRKVQINEENILAQNKKSSDSMKVMQSDLLEVKRDIEDIKEKIRLIVKELKLTAKSDDVKVVEKYLDLWEPVEFVTRAEARKMIDREIEERLK